MGSDGIPRGALRTARERQASDRDLAGNLRISGVGQSQAADLLRLGRQSRGTDPDMVPERVGSPTVCSGALFPGPHGIFILGKRLLRILHIPSISRLGSGY